MWPFVTPPVTLSWRDDPPRRHISLCPKSGSIVTPWPAMAPTAHHAHAHVTARNPKLWPQSWLDSIFGRGGGWTVRESKSEGSWPWRLHIILAETAGARFGLTITNTLDQHIAIFCIFPRPFSPTNRLYFGSFIHWGQEKEKNSVLR